MPISMKSKYYSCYILIFLKMINATSRSSSVLGFALQTVCIIIRLVTFHKSN